MKYFIGQVETSKGNKWFLFRGSSKNVVLQAQLLRKHPVVDGTFKELTIEKFLGYKRTLGFKVLNS